MRAVLEGDAQPRVGGLEVALGQGLRPCLIQLERVAGQRGLSRASNQHDGQPDQSQ